MTLVSPKKLSDFSGAEAALLDLCRQFAPEGFDPQCLIVQPDEIPHPQDQLLVHHAHMTEVLQKHHGRAMEVHVQDWRLDGDLYSRKIALNPVGNDKVVEWGIVRLDFRYMSQAVRDEIMARRKPLGAILIAHNVHRRIKPRWFLRFPVGGPVLRLFEPPEANEPSGFAYGRIGMIYCNEEPAIELLEVVLNVDAPGTNQGRGIGKR